MFAVMLVPGTISLQMPARESSFMGKEHAFNPAVGMLHLKHLKVMFLNMAHNVSYFTIA